MMKNLIYIPIVFLLGVIFLLASHFTDNRAVEKEIALFPEVKVWELKSFKITDQNKKILHFKRKNCVWTLGEEALATNEMLVTNLVDQIIGLHYFEIFAGSKEAYLQYLVDQDLSTYRIDFTLSEGNVKTLYLGSTPSLGLRYGRISEAKDIYILSEESIQKIPMEIERWLPEQVDT